MRTTVPVLAAAALLAGCATTTAPTERAAIETSARAFMADYAHDLAAGDRAALADRYSRDGNWIVFEGRRMFMSHAAMRERYMTSWEAPAAFAWRDLAYEVTSPASVVVTGNFDWTTPSAVEHYSYTGLLVREEGAWRIRLEDETQFGTTPAAIAGADGG